MSAEQFDESVLEERHYDHKWVVDNLHLFVPLVRDGLAFVGRGAILVNVAELILRKHSEEGHPFNYHGADSAWTTSEDFSDEEKMSLHTHLDTYAPDQEFILVLVKSDRATIHRVPLPAEDEMDFEIRGAYVNAEAEERQKRLTCTDFWAREFRLTSTYTLEWLYRVSGPADD